MTFQRAPHTSRQNLVLPLHNVLPVLLLRGAVIILLAIVLSQFLQFSKAQVLYMPASEYGNATLNYTPEVYNPENIFDAFDVFESILELINLRQHDARLSAPIGRLDIFLRRLADGAEGTSFCTASLISDRHILTNYHCIPGDKETSEGIRVERATLRLGYLSKNQQGEEFKVNIKPIESDSILDYSILELTELPNPAYGKIDLTAVRDPHPIENLFIIHHPGGTPKAITRERCYVHPSSKLLTGSEIFHKCDTQKGSSGALVFSDKTGQPVGMHWGGYDESLPLEQRYNVAKRLTTIIERSVVIKQITGATAKPTVPMGSGILKLSSSPLGANVYLNGQLLGRTPLEASVPEGNYQADLKLEGHETFKVNVVMRKDTKTEGTLQLKQKNDNYVYSIPASQHRPQQQVVMPPMLNELLVDPYATYFTAPPQSSAPIAIPVGVSTGVSNPSNITNISMVTGARPVNSTGSTNHGPNQHLYSANYISTPSASSYYSGANYVGSNYIGATSTTTDGTPTSAFTNSAAVNPNLTTTIYAQTPVDIDPINPTQAGDDTVGLNNSNSGIAGVHPQGARWDVIGRGESSNKEHMSFVIVHDASTLFKVWATAYGNVSVVPSLPSIDFARESVVGVFLGVQPASGLNLQINKVLLKSEMAHIHVSMARPYNNNIVSQGFVSPWILVRVPKAKIETVIFHDSQTSSLLGIAEKQ